MRAVELRLIGPRSDREAGISVLDAATETTVCAA
jgi:hypothetical protein